MTETVAPSGVLGTLGIDGTLFVAQLINFAIVLLIVWRWVYKPLVKLMEDRAKKINDGLANAEQAKRQLAAAAIKQDELLRAARQEAQHVLEAARADAEGERREIKEQTKQELERQLTEARARLKQEKEAAIKTVKHELADLVVAASGKVAALSISEGDQRKFVNQVIKDLEKQV